LFIYYGLLLFLFEGRINLLHKYDHIWGLEYAVIVNIIIGIVIVFIFHFSAISSGSITLKQLELDL